MPYKDKEKQRACARASWRKHGHKWKKPTREHAKDAELRRNYGITLEKYNEMATTQGHRCAICKRTVKLFVDHNHTTKIVRALLYNKCNLLIGQAKEDWWLLREAATYVRVHGTSH